MGSWKMRFFRILPSGTLAGAVLRGMALRSLPDNTGRGAVFVTRPSRRDEPTRLDGQTHSVVGRSTRKRSRDRSPVVYEHGVMGMDTVLGQPERPVQRREGRMT